MTRVGLVLLTWNDQDNLEKMLPSLATTEEPFDLFVVDNGSTDFSWDMFDDWDDQVHLAAQIRLPDASLTRALNVGFGQALETGADYDYIGWIHPDHMFPDPHWLSNLAREMDCHPTWAKCGANEQGDYQLPERPGNSQCFLIRRSALETVGLFDEGFIGIGGYEDWDWNRRALAAGLRVMLTPAARVFHVGMATRLRRDTVAEGRANARYYGDKWGDWDPPV